jgi:ubiquinone/menaquinone biosynthesis C-methylase UbiE
MDFDDIAAQYDGWFTTPLGAQVDQWEKEITWRFTKPRPGERVLDIGTGTANYLLDLAQRGLDCYGLDVGFKMLSFAKEKSARAHLPITLLQAASEALPFRDAQFDLVLSVTAFEFFSDPEKAVSEMVRVCKPGGRVVISILNKWSLWAVRRRIISWHKETIFSQCRFYSYREMKKLLGNVEWGTAVFSPPGLPDWLIPLARRLEPLLQRIARPFGAYLVVCREVTNVSSERK